MAKSLVIDTRYPHHANKHARGGDDEIDGDKLGVSYNPTGYIPDTSISEADSVDDLSAHLKGISDELKSKDLYNVKPMIRSFSIDSTDEVWGILAPMPSVSTILTTKVLIIPAVIASPNNDATFKVGYDTGTNQLMGSSDVDVYTAGIYTVENLDDVSGKSLNAEYIADTGFASGDTAGSIVLEINYFES